MTIGEVLTLFEDDPGAVVEVYRGDPPLLRFRIDLVKVLARALFRRVPERFVPGTQIVARVREGRDQRQPAGPVNLEPRLGLLEIALRSGGSPVWEGVFPISELIGPEILEIAQQQDRGYQGTWSYRLAAGRRATVVLAPRGPRSSGLSGAGLSGSSGSSGSSSALNSSGPGLAITPAPARSLEVVEPGQTGGPQPLPGRIAVLYSAAAHGELTRTLRLSRMHEDGGFLEGDVVQAGQDGGHIVRISTVHPAEHGQASPTHYVFTNESYSAISARLAESSGRLVGWYHTHLFDSGVVGLSQTDVHTHLGTFRQPWQVAALVNLSLGGTRRLRTYCRDGDTMTECDQWVAAPDGGFRRVSSEVEDSWG